MIEPIIALRKSAENATCIAAGAQANLPDTVSI
jgi:hypothetical protein